MSNFTFTGQLRTVRFALQGIRTVLASQHNAWVHAGASVAAVAARAVLRSAFGTAAARSLTPGPQVLRML